MVSMKCEPIMRVWSSSAHLSMKTVYCGMRVLVAIPELTGWMSHLLWPMNYRGVFSQLQMQRKQMRLQIFCIGKFSLSSGDNWLCAGEQVKMLNSCVKCGWFGRPGTDHVPSLPLSSTVEDSTPNSNHTFSTNPCHHKFLPTHRTAFTDSGLLNGFVLVFSYLFSSALV